MTLDHSVDSFVEVDVITTDSIAADDNTTDLSVTTPQEDKVLAQIETQQAAEAQERAMRLALLGNSIPSFSMPESLVSVAQQYTTLRLGPPNYKIGDSVPATLRAVAKTFPFWKSVGSKDAPAHEVLFNPINGTDPLEWLPNCTITGIKVDHLVDDAGTYDYHKVSLLLQLEGEAYNLQLGCYSWSSDTLLAALYALAEQPDGLKTVFHLRATTAKKASLEQLQSTIPQPVFVSLQALHRPTPRGDLNAFIDSFYKHDEVAEFLKSHRDAIKEATNKKQKASIAADHEERCVEMWQQLAALFNGEIDSLDWQPTGVFEDCQDELTDDELPF